MYTVIVKNYETQAELIRLAVKKVDRLWDVLPALSRKQSESDVLGTGYIGEITDLGISAWTRRGNVIDSTRAESSLEQSKHQPVKMLKDGKTVETNVKIGIIAYPEGYILGTGKVLVGILGTKSDAYLSYIGKANVHSEGKSGCHIFPSLKNLDTYIHKHEKTLRWLVSEHGYEFSVDYANDLFRRDVEKLPEAKKTSLSKQMDKIISFLEDINATTAEEPEDGKLPENPTEADVLEEVVGRMKSLNLFDRIVLDYKGSGEIFQSVNGIVFDLDDNAKTAIRQVEDMGLIPYHVIISKTTIGRMYSVLYVSRTSEEWKLERWDKKGWLMAYVYNADYPELSEIGSIHVEPVNGGIIRLL